MVEIETRPPDSPPYKIETHRPDNPQMVVYCGKYRMSFSIAGFDPDSYDWLGSVLSRQIKEIVDRTVKDEISSLQSNLRSLLGVRQ